MNAGSLRRVARNIALCVAVQAMLLQAAVAAGGSNGASGNRAGSMTGTGAPGTAGSPGAAANAVPRLDARISCSSRHAGRRQDRGGDVDDRSEYADSAEMHLQGDRIESFRWESSLFRSTTGFECSIDDSDGLLVDYLPPVAGDPPGRRWRVQLQDGWLARARRGYDADHGFNCSIRLEQRGDILHILPSCPALCGSRENFSALAVDLKTGQCEYEH